MRREEWIGATVVAIAVAGIIVALSRPPFGLANATRPAVVVPALPPAELAIPSLGATVAASADPQPGRPVRVKLSLRADPAAAGQNVPITVVLLSAPPSDPRARMVLPPMPVATAETSLLIGPDGQAEGEVELAAEWARSAPPTTQPDLAATTVNVQPPNGQVPRLSPQLGAGPALFVIRLASSVNGPVPSVVALQLTPAPTTQPEQP